MDDLARDFKSSYKQALEHAIRGRTEDALNICWDLRLEPRLGPYRRSMLNVLFAQILEPFGEIGVTEECLDVVRDLQQRIGNEPNESLDYLRRILEGLAKSSQIMDGYRLRRTALGMSQVTLDLKSQGLRQYQYQTKTLFRSLRQSSFKADKAEGWEQEDVASREEKVALEMAHLTKEEDCAWEFWSSLDKERTLGNIREEESQELLKREAVAEAWQKEVSKRKARLMKREVQMLEQKGFSLMDQLRGILKQTDATQMADAEEIFHEELRMPLVRPFSEEQARRKASRSA